MSASLRGRRPLLGWSSVVWQVVGAVATIGLPGGWYHVVDPYRYDEARRFERGWNRGAEAVAGGGVVRSVGVGRVAFAGLVAGRLVVTVRGERVGGSGAPLVMTYTGLRAVDVAVGARVGEGTRLGSGGVVHVGAYDAAVRYRYVPIRAVDSNPLARGRSPLADGIASRLAAAIAGSESGVVYAGAPQWPVSAPTFSRHSAARVWVGAGLARTSTAVRAHPSAGSTVASRALVWGLGRESVGAAVRGSPAALSRRSLPQAKHPLHRASTHRPHRVVTDSHLGAVEGIGHVVDEIGHAIYEIVHAVARADVARQPHGRAPMMPDVDSGMRAVRWRRAPDRVGHSSVMVQNMNVAAAAVSAHPAIAVGAAPVGEQAPAQRDDGPARGGPFEFFRQADREPLWWLTALGFVIVIVAARLAWHRHLNREGDLSTARAAHFALHERFQVALLPTEHTLVDWLREDDAFTFHVDLERVALADLQPLSDLDRDDDATEFIDLSNNARVLHVARTPRW